MSHTRRARCVAGRVDFTNRPSASNLVLRTEHVALKCRAESEGQGTRRFVPAFRVRQGRVLVRPTVHLLTEKWCSTSSESPRTFRWGSVSSHESVHKRPFFIVGSRLCHRFQSTIRRSPRFKFTFLKAASNSF